MPEPHSRDPDFLTKVTDIIEENMTNEQFGVSELAREIGMSRSNLLRKIKKLSKLSVSQFISQVRLKHAMELLKEQSFTVSEVSYRVGFSSTSYFIKCFREFYGYPPGEVGKRATEEPASGEQAGSQRKRLMWIAGALVLILAVVLLLVVTRPGKPSGSHLEKSIAVLPFNNDSNDSTNLYIINGLMESILENLQHIEDLRVISRTSVEKYRSNPKTSPEIARELNAKYLVEGSGQKIGDEILLNVQLIEAATDTHLWAERYKRRTGDIFELQQEVARSIAAEIEAIITPEEAEQIEKVPTENLEAYDYFLQGMEFFNRETREGLEEAIPLFKKAIELDPKFARAYADMAIAYAFLDMFRVEKVYGDQIDYYADKAMLNDPTLSLSLIAKAMFHYTRAEYDQALPYLEKALEYHPNSALVINILSDYYSRFAPNTELYLEYALMGIGLDIAAHDSTDASIIYLHVANAFMQNGFVDEAGKYIERSLEYDPDNLYSGLLRIYILLAKGASLQQTRERLEALLQHDTTRYDIIKELGIICYYLKDYQGAYQYFSKMYELTHDQGLDRYQGEKAKMGLCLARLGMTVESQRYFQEYLDYAQNDQSIYRDLSLAAYYSYQGDIERALEHMRMFSKQEKYPYWYILFLDMEDPLFEPVSKLPEFREILDEIEANFWAYQQELRESLEEKGLL
jgi:TolB-like protein/AraC-like DNA-binding protein/Tfp pilus assembly protein PilF